MTTQTASNVPDLTLGFRLQMALRHADVSVQEMAEELGMGRASLSRWLNDHAVPRRVVLKQWALRTGVSFEWLATGEAPRPSPDGADAPSVGLEPTTVRLIVFPGQRRALRAVDDLEAVPA